MKKKIIVLSLIIDAFVVLLLLAIFVPAVGSPFGIGRTSTDEFCAQCGSFRSASYVTFPGVSLQYGAETRGEEGLKLLHDTYSAPCKEHKWCIFHQARGSVAFSGISHPLPAIGLEFFKNYGKAPLVDLIAEQPELASRSASTIFSYSAGGKSVKRFSDLTIAIEMKEPADISKILDEMTGELAKP